MFTLLPNAVLEVFSTWCGSCKSVLPMCKKIRIEKDDEAALTFLTVSVARESVKSSSTSAQHGNERRTSRALHQLLA
jgi:thiol-disulfide isomerase/thioredoxin